MAPMTAAEVNSVMRPAPRPDSVPNTAAIEVEAAWTNEHRMMPTTAAGMVR